MRYRKVSTAMWADEKFRVLEVDGKLAFVAVLTHPSMTSVGAMRGTLAGLAAELGWSLKRCERALAPALEAKMVEINAGAAYIALPNFLKHNPPENPNVVKGWAAAIVETVPECPERQALVERCRATLAALDVEKPDAFRKAFADSFERLSKGLPHAFRIPEQEQLPEQQQEERPLLLPPLKSGGQHSSNGRPARKRVNADWLAVTAAPDGCEDAGAQRVVAGPSGKTGPLPSRHQKRARGGAGFVSVP